MAERKFFGTDGIRGFVGEGPITPEFVMKLGWAAGRVLSQTGTKKVLIGKDTRISGYMLESALEAGLAAAGLKAAFTGPMPTPAVAYLTRTFRAEAGIVISASHNPYHDNGIKFFSAQGTKLPDDVEAAIEAEMEKPLTCVESALLGKAYRIDDAAGRYIEFCKGTFPNHLSLEGFKIVVDCAHGATYHIAPKVFTELGAEIAYIIARDALRCGELKGGVVGTLMTNMGMEVALKNLGIPFVRAKVGDRYVMEELLKNNWLIGAENSGHVILLDKVTTGDGIVAGLQVMASIVSSKMSLKELSDGMTMFPQVLENVRFKGENNPLLSEAVIAATKAVEKKLGDNGRVLLRKSGTEPLIRVMVEGQDAVDVKQYALDIAKAVKENC
jgi:phosphoglucosamine mutase